MVFSHKACAIKLKEPLRARDSLHVLQIFLKGKTDPEEIDLDNYIGCSEGVFTLIGNKFSRDANMVMIRGPMLYAKLPYGEEGNYREAKLNLDFCLFYDDNSHNVSFIRPSRKVQLSCSNFILENGSFLKALCLGKDGLLHESSIDLNQHLEVENGKLQPGSRGFLHHGANGNQSFTLRDSYLCARLNGRQTQRGIEIVESMFDLSTRLENLNGSLDWPEQWPILGRDGLLARLLDPLPLIGFFTAYLHRITGNEDHAARAFSKASGATMLFTGCLIISIFTVNPLSLALAGAALTPLAIEIERHIAEGTIEDKTVRATIQADAGRYVRDAIINSLAAGGAGNFIMRFIRPQKEVLKEKAKVLLKQSAWEVSTDYFSDE
ncbi:uncharacterized protein TRIVIDRAFT_222442 [Trichoderma virens Gv29-8]|uniref:Cyanovirin-N domain-containing protein n=1 Tax=Hypocrea virens (strain Gv29-8 / FGSC 10586) TaxID=413071 RepID=G9MTW0_HYPVG|nr:uncharacterized protein TRIVIDRAFT_222442 [Trichoderma virens Gv29-8]EHK22121.1 hypothetical protein TRIVIDRAFT_222442 [Trichoderma virens Gv29-8]